ncbi:MAG: DnaJ domain-containing protein, partial [Duncaniella sp.]|nr:DnaJ domain-containing protein [Duncaniella sp.]
DKEAEEKFKEAAEAYDVLSNPEKRAKYDQFGHDMGPQGFPGGGGFYSSGGMSMEDIFANFGDIFGGAFGGMGGFGSAGAGRARKRQRRGTDLRIKVKVTLEDIAKGVTKTLKIPTFVKDEHCNGTGAKDGTAFSTCPTCNGTGTVLRSQQTIFGMSQSQVQCPQCQGEGKIITEKCHYCNGEGVERKEELVSFTIPAGVADGMTLTVKGKGNAAIHGGVNGDLLVVIEEIPHPELLRDGNDVIYNLMLDIPTAALGGSVEVPTITGRARLKIPAGTQPGKVLRLRGKGLPSTEGYGTGDELINVMVYIPENMTDEEKRAIESLSGKPNMQPSQSVKDRIFSKLRHIFD